MCKVRTGLGNHETTVQPAELCDVGGLKSCTHNITIPGLGILGSSCTNMPLYMLKWNMPRSRQNIHAMCLHTMAVHMYICIFLHCINSICGKTMMSVSVHHSIPVNTCTDGPMQSTSKSSHHHFFISLQHYLPCMWSQLLWQ